MGLIRAPNTTRWPVGDFVIHDADAKRADMLMVVTGCSRDMSVQSLHLDDPADQVDGPLISSVTSPSA